jgi:hypothetical protein
MKLVTSTQILSAALLSLSLAACGGGTATSGSVGGTVTGLNSGTSVTLQNNGADNITMSSNTAFTFPTQIANLSPFSVTVMTQPLGETCSVTNGSGVIPTDGTTVNNVAVTCALNASVGGTVTGLAPGTSVTLSSGAGTQATIDQNGQFAIAGLLPAGTAYTVSVTTQPAVGTCSVTSPSGTITSGVESMVTVSCQ